MHISQTLSHPQFAELASALNLSKTPAADLHTGETARPDADDLAAGWTS